MASPDAAGMLQPQDGVAHTRSVWVYMTGIVPALG